MPMFVQGCKWFSTTMSHAWFSTVALRNLLSQATTSLAMAKELVVCDSRFLNEGSIRGLAVFFKPSTHLICKEEKLIHCIAGFDGHWCRALRSSGIRFVCCCSCNTAMACASILILSSPSPIQFGNFDQLIGFEDQVENASSGGNEDDKEEEKAGLLSSKGTCNNSFTAMDWKVMVAVASLMAEYLAYVCLMLWRPKGRGTIYAVAGDSSNVFFCWFEGQVKNASNGGNEDDKEEKKSSCCPAKGLATIASLLWTGRVSCRIGIPFSDVAEHRGTRGAVTSDRGGSGPGGGMFIIRLSDVVEARGRGTIYAVAGHSSRVFFCWSVIADLLQMNFMLHGDVKRLYDTFHEPFKRMVSSQPAVPETSVQKNAEPSSAGEVAEVEKDGEDINKRRKTEPELNVKLKSALKAAFAKYAQTNSQKNNKSTVVKKAVEHSTATNPQAENGESSEKAGT
ncbi:hypothetical protein SLEP1_g31493 [Rubroshorea leprosula]|uniref:Uncharacterized protein n=1 Tax=Rubroshorea leprosula TaxID=152421 RepID=A0AAV5K3I2_9ROSI|nr:hypothetical protein SLEP1_g31493 [Rubroshorea leprosula]